MCYSWLNWVMTYFQLQKWAQQHILCKILLLAIVLVIYCLIALPNCFTPLPLLVHSTFTDVSTTFWHLPLKAATPLKIGHYKAPFSQQQHFGLRCARVICCEQIAAQCKRCFREVLPCTLTTITLAQTYIKKLTLQIKSTFYTYKMFLLQL